MAIFYCFYVYKGLQIFTVTRIIQKGFDENEKHFGQEDSRRTINLSRRFESQHYQKHMMKLYFSEMKMKEIIKSAKMLW